LRSATSLATTRPTPEITPLREWAIDVIVGAVLDQRADQVRQMIGFAHGALGFDLAANSDSD
jgi:hypothetical protein